MILMILLIVFVVIALQQSLRIIKQQQIAVVERLGKFRRTLEPGPHLLVPLVDRVRYTMDMREEVQAFPPQGVITEENLMVNIDSVIYFQIVDPVRAAYEAQNYRGAIEQLTMTTLRNIIGGMDLERALTSREEINQKLRAVLDEATGKWGIKVNRVELRAIEPPATIRDAMEKGARAERDKRAQILLAEGQRQSQILSAGGERESAILRAQGDREAAVLRAQADRQAQMLRAEGEAQAITTVFNAIHAGEPDQGLLAYQYMQMLPALARGDSNKVWIVPSELNDALKGLGSAVGGTELAEKLQGFNPVDKTKFSAPEKVDVMAEIQAQTDQERAQSDKTVQSVIEEAEKLSNPAIKPRKQSAPLDPSAGAAQIGGSTAAPGIGQGQSDAVAPADQPQPMQVPGQYQDGNGQAPAGPSYQTGWEPPQQGQ
ncbi:SPFH domain-containing protein [Luteococcus sp. H138]|uniref:SPFH domain-containing protein n=1 Tax=unclassified Luteococcus TaxID=2639923 RepID=UPI00313D8E8C